MMAGRSVVIGDVPWVSQCAEAFASKLFACSYSNTTPSFYAANPADHLVHRRAKARPYCHANFPRSCTGRHWMWWVSMCFGRVFMTSWWVPMHTLYWCRLTHRVVRGGLLAVGRPDGRISGLSSQEASACLSVNQGKALVPRYTVYFLLNPIIAASLMARWQKKNGEH